uniref:Uncharacterized protein n=1 Tax=Triticum urartu TaxID=4572 RepID=A0A8R7PFH0_TRIUA
MSQRLLPSNSEVRPARNLSSPSSDGYPATTGRRQVYW